MYSNQIENIYGSRKRLAWIKSIINKSQSIIELGCGTGYMITMPRLKCGYDIVGIDVHEESIKHGRLLLKQEELSVENLKCCKLADLDRKIDVIIASEVLEHHDLAGIESILREVKLALKDGGIFLVTVPNGFGWYEFENYIWNKCNIAGVVERYKFHIRLAAIKEEYFGMDMDSNELSTLDTSPHLQSFTLRSVRKLLATHGFEVVEATGTVLVSGPLSHIFFRGITPLLKLNCYLGGVFPSLASGFLLRCRMLEK